MLSFFLVSCSNASINSNIPLLGNKQQITHIKDNVNIIYRQIKKNEIKPATDYLFNNSFTNNSKNLEKTIAKLDKMSELGFISFFLI